MDKLLSVKARLRKFNFIMTRPIIVVIVLVLLMGVALIRQQSVINNTRTAAENAEIAARDAKTSADNSVQLLIRMKESLCLLVVHAEESPDVVITSEIREFCGDIFRVNPITPPAEPSQGEPMPSPVENQDSQEEKQTPEEEPRDDEPGTVTSALCSLPLINQFLEQCDG